MKWIKTIVIIPTLAFFLLASCQDDAKRNEDVEILESDEIETDIGDSEEPAGREGEDDNLYRSIRADEDLSSFAEGLEASGMEQDFNQNQNGSYTVFAPSNSAFDALSEEERNQLKDPNLSEQNRNLWEYYMVDGNMTADYFSKKLEVGQGPWTITTLQGEDIKAFYEGDKLVLEDARGNRAEVERSIETSDGVVHITNQVLSPSGGLTGSEVEVNSEVQTDQQF